MPTPPSGRSLNPTPPYDPQTTTDAANGYSKILVAISRKGNDFSSRLKSSSFLLPPGPYAGPIAGAAMTFPTFFVDSDESMRVEAWADCAKDVFMCVQAPPFALAPARKRAKLSPARNGAYVSFTRIPADLPRHQRRLLQGRD